MEDPKVLVVDSPANQLRMAAGLAPLPRVMTIFDVLRRLAASAPDIQYRAIPTRRAFTFRRTHGARSESLRIRPNRRKAAK